MSLIVGRWNGSNILKYSFLPSQNICVNGSIKVDVFGVKFRPDTLSRSMKVTFCLYFRTEEICGEEKNQG
jgi:hypothetical protein